MYGESKAGTDEREFQPLQARTSVCDYRRTLSGAKECSMAKECSVDFH